MWFGITVSVLCFWLFRRDRLTLARRINRAGAFLYPRPVIGVMATIYMRLA